MWLVVGLGNPGRRYAATRHNVGFSVIETLAKRWSIPAEGKQLGSLVGTGRLGDCKGLARPQSFMNRSGTRPVVVGHFKPGRNGSLLRMMTSTFRLAASR